MGRKTATSYNNVVRLLGFQSTPVAEGNTYFVKTNILGSFDIRLSFLHSLLKEIHARHRGICESEGDGKCKGLFCRKKQPTCSIVVVVEGGGSKSKIFSQVVDHRSCSSATLVPNRLETKYVRDWDVRGCKNQVRTEIQVTRTRSQ